MTFVDRTNASLADHPITTVSTFLVVREACAISCFAMARWGLELPIEYPEFLVARAVNLTAPRMLVAGALTPFMMWAMGPLKRIELTPLFEHKNKLPAAVVKMWDKLERPIRDYGVPFFVVERALFFASSWALYAAVKSGVDVTGYLGTVSDYGPYVGTMLGQMTFAEVVNEVFLPVQVLVTLYVAPSVLAAVTRAVGAMAPRIKMMRRLDAFLNSDRDGTGSGAGAASGSAGSPTSNVTGAARARSKATSQAAAASAASDAFSGPGATASAAATEAPADAADDAKKAAKAKAAKSKAKKGKGKKGKRR